MTLKLAERTEKSSAVKENTDNKNMPSYASTQLTNEKTKMCKEIGRTLAQMGDNFEAFFTRRNAETAAPVYNINTGGQ